MRVVVTGATGNVGTSVLRALAEHDRVESILGVVRRLPEAEFAKTTFVAADVAEDDLVPHFRGADAVVHLAWLIQPSRDEAELESVNVDGSDRVFAAAGEAEVPKLVYASSVGAYSPGPKDRAVDESHPTDGIESSFYARHKAKTERLLDSFERQNPGTAVVRLRPALIFKRDAASGIRRLFAGPFLPSPLLPHPHHPRHRCCDSCHHGARLCHCGHARSRFRDDLPGRSPDARLGEGVNDPSASRFGCYDCG